MRKRFVLATLTVLALGWLLLVVAGHPLALLVSGRAGNTITRLARGKVADPSVFIYGRSFDFLLLATILVLLVLVFLPLRRRLCRCCPNYSWVWQFLLIFFLLNIWIAAAMRRPLFWALLYSGEGTWDFTQFNLKRTLSAEAPPIPRALLLGSSQVRAQIDEGLLNEELAHELWTTELSFPGAGCFDLALVFRRLKSVRSDLVITYVSEGYFFSGESFTTLPYFGRFRDLPWFLQMHVPHLWKERSFYTAILGSASPLFRCRGSIAQRLLGKTFTVLGQLRYDQGLQANLLFRAIEAAPGITSNEYTALQERAFDSFLQDAAARRTQVIVLVGQFNPLLGERIDPSLRPRMLNFLHQMAKKYPHLTLVENAPFLNNRAEEYQDLTHVSHEAQKSFTIELANWLRAHQLKAPPE